MPIPGLPLSRDFRIISSSTFGFRALLGIGGIAMVTSLSSGSAAAQNAVSKPVVQQLPSPETSRLNTALRRLARNSRDIGALVDAGEASLKLDDVDAAVGFFVRARDLSPQNPRVKAGLASAFVRQKKPIEALKLFDEAQAAGASVAGFAGDRALAYDLVGDNVAAMGLYRQALQRKEDAVVRRRFALSHAIAGDRGAFDAVLAPLIEKQDAASYRTRAFGLAILGEADEAIAIADAVMPKNLAARMAPYLRYMPRLTKAQQAAAANFGSFPRASLIGRDSPQIANYTAGGANGANADARLTPQGEPLGPRVDSTSVRRRPDRRSSAVETVAEPPVELVRAAPLTTDDQSSPSGVVIAQTPAPEVATAASPARVPGTMVAVPGFDLEKVAEAGRPAADKEVASVAEAFANFEGPTVTANPNAGGVDITKITPPREVAKKPEPKAVPKPPEHPRRFWVQVATGRDRDALKFDWRRISRKAPEILGDISPHVTAWGQSNRLLAGPFKSAKSARNTMNSLKENDIDSFTFTSPEGQEINKL